MKKAIGLALVMLMTSVVAASAQGAHKVAASAASSQSISCSSTMTIPFLTPLTGGAGFLGTEQASWAKYAVQTLPKKYGLKVKLALGDTPVEQGPAPAQALAQKYISDKSVVAILGPSTSGDAAATAKPFFAAGPRGDLPVGDSHGPDDRHRRRPAGRNTGVLPRRPG